VDIVQENALVVAPRVTLLSTLMYILINSGGWLVGVGVGVDLYYLSGGLRENWTICLVMVSDIFAWLSLYYIILYYIILYIKLKEFNATYLSFDIISIELDLTDKKKFISRAMLVITRKDRVR